LTSVLKKESAYDLLLLLSGVFFVIGIAQVWIGTQGMWDAQRIVIYFGVSIAAMYGYSKKR